MTHFEEYLAAAQRFGIRPGLERIRALLALIDNPQSRYPHLIVGGTNGKGSVAQFLAQMLSGDTRKIGLYTSPHLHRWNERIRILNADSIALAPRTPFADAISDGDLETLFQSLQPLIDTVTTQHGPTTEFELMTVLGLWHFARCNVDGAVIEVGLGGLWDATNVTDPLVSVVTHVALDHCDRLGATVEAIARDKIAIARANRVVVTAETNPAVLQIFAEHCAQIGARLWPWRRPDLSNDPTAAQLISEIVAEPTPLNEHAPAFQTLNYRTARLAHRAFCDAANWPFPAAAKVPQMASKVPQNDVASQWSVAGRFEIIEREPTILLDGANNPDGAAHLLQALQVARANRTGRLILVLGVSADKDYNAMLQILAPHADVLIATQADSPRALPAAELSQAASKYRRAAGIIETVVAVRDALQRAREIALAADWIVVTGSFFVLGEIERPN